MAGVLLCSLHAPYQCASDPDPARAREESAPEALWLYAERLAQRGDRSGRRSVLEFLVERYPSSRFAARARMELEALPPGHTESVGGGGAAPPPSR